MEYNVRDDAMRLVVNYLSSEDLKNASSTCRSWSQLIDDETKRKGPRLVTQEIIINRYNRAVFAKNEHIFVSTDTRPLLLLCFTNKNCNYDIVKRHVFKLRPMHCILAQLKRNLFEDVNRLWMIVIPFSFNLIIDSLSLIIRSRGPKHSYILTLQRKRRRFYAEIHKGLDKFFSETYIYEGPSLTYFFCTVLFCTYSEIPSLKNIIARFSTWYPYAGPIWGCTLESIEAFFTTPITVKELNQTDIIHFIITGKDLVTKLLILNEHCNTKEKIQKKFEDLKNEINLKKYSIAFLCTSAARFNEFYEIESTAFKEIFPQVTLAHIFSRRPFAAKTLYEFNKCLEDMKPHVGNNDTTFILFTYN